LRKTSPPISIPAMANSAKNNSQFWVEN